MIYSLSEDNSIHVYNSASSLAKSATNLELIDFGTKVIENHPFEEMLWRPSINYTTCFYYFYLTSIIKQVLPAILFDTIMYITGKPSKYDQIYLSV